MTAINFYYSLGNEDVGYGVFFDGADTLFCAKCNTQIHHIEGDYGNCVSDCEKHSRALSKILCTFNQLYGDGSDSYSDSDSDDDLDTSSRNSAGGARNSAAGGAAAGGAGAYSYSIEDLDFSNFYPDNEMN